MTSPAPIPIHPSGASSSMGSPPETDLPAFDRRGSTCVGSISFGPGSLGFAPMSFTNNSYARSPFGGGQAFRFFAAGTPVSSWRAGNDGMAMSISPDSAMDSFDTSKLGTSADHDLIGLDPGSLRLNQLESTFCRNFTCCGLDLPDLHDLLQHYEEQHVRLDELDDTTPPGMVLDDGCSEQSSNSSNPSSPAVTTVLATANGARSLSANAAALAAVNQRKRTMNGFASAAGAPPASLGGLRHLAHPRRAGSSFAGAGATGEDAANADPVLGQTSFGGLSLRPPGVEDHGLSPCAPPNLFFPANGVVAQAAQQVAGAQPGPPRSRATTPKAPSQRISPGAESPATKFDTKSVVAAPGNVGKPFKCPSPGCDKAYKQMNGLKYHRLHGHCNQNLFAPTVPGPAAPATPGPSPSLVHPGGIQASTRPLFSSVASDSTANTVAASSAGSPLGARPWPTPTEKQARASPQRMGALASQPQPAASDLAEVQAQSQALASFPSCPTWSSAAPNAASAASTVSTGTTPAVSGHSGMPLDGRALYMCQVGTCGKTYKNLNGLRYHYLHSGSHGLLGLQILHAHGGGNSAKLGIDQRAVVSTSSLAPEEVARAARLAAEMQVKKAHVSERTVEMIQAQALAGGGPGHNHKQAQEMQAIVDADTAPQFDSAADAMDMDTPMDD